MKNRVWFIVLLLVIPIVLADISLDADLKDTYYLGEMIESSFEISLDSKEDILFKLRLNCEDFDLDYFVVLLNLDANKAVKVAPPSLKLNEKMKGECKLDVSLESLEKDKLDSFSSEEFEVVNDIEVILSTDKDSVLPGEVVTLKGVLSKIGSSLTIAFNGDQEFLDISSEGFTYEIKIPEDIKSGEHLLFVDVNDDFGNMGDANLGITVISMVSSIDFEVNKKVFKPSEIVRVKPKVYDQAGDVLDKYISVKVGSLFSDNVKSGEEIEFTLEASTEPGSYFLVASYEELSAEDIIVVEEVKLLDVVLNGEVVNIKNIGNVRYNDVAELNLFGDERNYFLSKKINLDVGESMQIDLSKEVPTDNYDVDFVVEDKEIKVGEKVPIEDKRSVFGKITGAVVAVGDGLLARNPIVASIVLILAIVGIVVYFIMRNKKEKDNIF